MKMVKIIKGLLVIAGIILYSCSNSDKKINTGKELSNTVMQDQDGTVSLLIDEADTYHDSEDPESNTAEWNVLISKSGRYDIWLSSATKDTTRLEFDNSVMLSIKDDLLEAYPSVDKVIHNSTDVFYPFFRADSFMGSLYLQDTGMYNIQVISDKILPEDPSEKSLETDATKILSVFLTPAN
ncbi:MAG TPA: hypothetical protein VHO50_09900 [Bacteroidales bacterium]|nr:hypothetical protein [Bacteroidales bacterium]